MIILLPKNQRRIKPVVPNCPCVVVYSPDDQELEVDISSFKIDGVEMLDKVIVTVCGDEI